MVSRKAARLDLPPGPLTQFAENDLIAMFEVTMENEEIRVVQEKHYRLVPASEVTPDDLTRYRNSA